MTAFKIISIATADIQNHYDIPTRRVISGRRLKVKHPLPTETIDELHGPTARKSKLELPTSYESRELKSDFKAHSTK